MEENREQEVHKRVDVEEKGSQKKKSEINLGILLVLAILFFPLAVVYAIIATQQK